MRAAISVELDSSTFAVDERAYLALRSYLERAVGRVDGPALDDPAPSVSDHGERRGRRLYRLREGQQWAGVCAGLAAFAEVDAGIVRLIFILGTVVSGGMLALLHLVLVFVMPVAHTEAEIAEAHGGRRRD